MADRQALFDDPSILLVSSLGTSASNPTNEVLKITPDIAQQPEGRNALSLLLDSAIANAAKESTPELEPRSSGSARGSPKEVEKIESRGENEKQLQSKGEEYTVDYKSTTAYSYSINELILLRNSANVKEIQKELDLPEKSFWGLRQKTPKEKGPERRKKGGAEGLRWEKKPSGFARAAELDTMGHDKINQLLGENPDEAEPDWGTVDGSKDSQIDMGETVEDFERWKAEMRRRAEGEFSSEPLGNEPPVADSIPNNEVDNFFSFVKPKEKPKQESTSTSSKSSRFSSFFNAPAPPQRDSPQTSRPQSNQQTQPIGSQETQPMAPRRLPSQDESSSRFFGGNQSLNNNQRAPGTPGTPGTPQQNILPQGPPGLPRMYPPGLQSGPYGAPPPGLPAGGPPPGFGANDNFFNTLLNKSVPPQPSTAHQQQQQPRFPPPPGFAYPQTAPQNMKGITQFPPWMNMPPPGTAPDQAQTQNSPHQGFRNMPPGLMAQGPNQGNQMQNQGNPGQNLGNSMQNQGNVMSPQNQKNMRYQGFPPGVPPGFMYSHEQNHPHGQMPPGFPMYGNPMQRQQMQQGPLNAQSPRDERSEASP